VLAEIRKLISIHFGFATKILDTAILGELEFVTIRTNVSSPSRITRVPSAHIGTTAVLRVRLGDKGVKKPPHTPIRAPCSKF
jgi:hypothetical protein